MRIESRIGLLADTIASLGVGMQNTLESIAEFRAAVEAPMRKPRRMRRTRVVGRVRLNRSRHWLFAETYKLARAMSPTPWTPVR